MQSIEKVQQIRRHLKASQDRQKSWADVRRRPLEFQVGDYVFLKISPTRGVIRFGSRGKLSPRFIGPFEIIGRVGQVAYRLDLPQTLAGVHNVFHTSQLKKYLRDEEHVVDHSELEIGNDQTYKTSPVQILDRKEKVLRGKVIPLVLVAWDPNSPGECTWEREDHIRSHYPHLFT